MFSLMVSKVKELHKRDNPEVIASEITMANREYYNWLVSLNDRENNKALPESKKASSKT